MSLVEDFRSFGSSFTDQPASPDQSPSTNSVVASRLDYRRPGSAQGRLIGLSIDSGALAWLSSGQNPFTSTGGALVITFPSMPQVIELARSADFQVAPIYMAPDGIHRYIATKPMELPLSFQLSIHDHEYAIHGALTLLATAAKLHAFVLPISTNPDIISGYYAGAVQGLKQPGTSTSATTGLTGDATTPNTVDAKTGAQQDPNKQDTVQEQTSIGNYSGGEDSTYPPIPAMLNLISDGRDDNVSLGVNCVGYINAVRTRLKGPWLRPPNASGMNMPSVLEAEFTFVHYPGYTNSFKQNTTVNVAVRNAYADDVRDNFYNTLKLTTKSAMSFRGLTAS